jgi:hypothetical protein
VFQPLHPEFGRQIAVDSDYGLNTIPVPPCSLSSPEDLVFPLVYVSGTLAWASAVEWILTRRGAEERAAVLFDYALFP